MEDAGILKTRSLDVVGKRPVMGGPTPVDCDLIVVVDCRFVDAPPQPLTRRQTPKATTATRERVSTRDSGSLRNTGPAMCASRSHGLLPAGQSALGALTTKLSTAAETSCCCQSC